MFLPWEKEGPGSWLVFIIRTTHANSHEETKNKSTSRMFHNRKINGFVPLLSKINPSGGKTPRKNPLSCNYNSFYVLPVLEKSRWLCIIRPKQADMITPPADRNDDHVTCTTQTLLCFFPLNPPTTPTAVLDRIPTLLQPSHLALISNLNNSIDR